jgi:hypothetical protein
VADKFDIRPAVPKEAVCLEQSGVLKTLPSTQIIYGKPG